MNLEPLHPDLRDLEARLARRPGTAPAADFRARVLGATADALARPVAWRGGRGWGLVWRAAAVIVVAMNLGLSAANGVRFQHLTAAAQQRPMPAAGVDQEDRFLAWAAPALANWTPAPDVGAAGRNIFSMKEERGWDTP
jgi:hypothetical protein